MARNRPTDAELIEAVTEFLATEVEPEIGRSDVMFRLRVAMNVLHIVSRECLSGAVHDANERAVIQALLDWEATDLDELNEAMCEQVRRGDFDERHDELVDALTRVTLDKLSIDNPHYSTYKDMKKE